MHQLPSSQLVKYGTHFLWSRQIWNSYGELASSPNWTCEAHTTLFIYTRVISGIPPSLHHLGTMNIRLYHMAYPTLTLSSKAIWMKYSRSSFYDSSSSTLAISSSTPRTWLNNTSTSSMSLRSSAISISSWRSESSKLPPCTFWVMSLKTWHPDGPEEGGSDPKLVSTSYHQGTTTLTRICQFPPKVYPALQPAQFTSHMLTQELAQVSVLELTCLWSLPSTPRRLPDCSDPGSSQPRSPVHRWGGRLFHRGRSGPFSAPGWSNTTPSMCVLFEEVVPGGSELRYQKSWAPSHQASSWEVEISNICEMQRGWIHAKPGGHYSSPDLISRSLKLNETVSS